MEATDVETLSDLCDYITEHVATIYVREQVNNKRGAYSLAQLPSDLAVKHALRFIKEGVIPTRVKEVAHV